MKIFGIIFMVIPLIMLGGAMYYDVAVKTPKHQVWIDKCIANGGVPSEYKVLDYKTTDVEYLCIKPENIVEVK